MKKQLFFRSSRSACQQVTELFDFMWPTSLALWNLRWQVRGLNDVLDSPHQSILLDRFVSGSGIRANIKKACIERSWNEQEEQFAKFLLVDLFAIYEGWIDHILQTPCKDAIRKGLQFPQTVPSSLSYQNVYSTSLRLLQANPWALVKEAFYDSFLKNSKSSVGHLDQLLTCYRAFKEVRNCQMHANSICDARLKVVYDQYATLTIQDLSVKEKPEIPNLTVGKPAVLTLRSVVGFSEVVLKLIVSLDAELSVCSFAESEFREQWQVTHYGVKTVSPDKDKRHAHIKRLCAKLGLPRPLKVDALEQYLLSENLVRIG